MPSLSIRIQPKTTKTMSLNRPSVIAYAGHLEKKIKQEADKPIVSPTLDLCRTAHLPKCLLSEDGKITHVRICGTVIFQKVVFSTTSYKKVSETYEGKRKQDRAYDDRTPSLELEKEAKKEVTWASNENEPQEMPLDLSTKGRIDHPT